jgi:hypothetical protein
MSDAERIIRHGAVTFHTESFGHPAAPPILMIMGATASMLWWPDELCRALARGALPGVAVVVADDEEAPLGKLVADPLVPPDHRPAEPHDQQQRFATGVAEGLVTDPDAVHVRHALSHANQYDALRGRARHEAADGCSRLIEHTSVVG